MPNIDCKRREMRMLHGVARRATNLTSTRAQTIAHRGFAPQKLDVEVSVGNTTLDSRGTETSEFILSQT
jgi:hypothetical protein